MIEDVKRLNEAIRILTQRAFGSSSEQTPSDQLSLFEEDSESFNEGEPTPLEQTVEETITYKRKKPRGRKAELTKDLPTEYHICDLSEGERTCDCCQHGLTAIGKRDVRTEVEFVPAHMVKHVYQEMAFIVNIMVSEPTLNEGLALALSLPIVWLAQVSWPGYVIRKMK
nr:IS66 family transposase zinc-finger binding domain-containing protein [Enterococcus plantarum]